MIALTGGVMPGQREAAQAAGVDGILSKSISLAELRALLARHAPEAASGQ